MPLLFAYESAQKIVPSMFIDPGMALGTSVVLLGLFLFATGAAYSFNKGAMFRLSLVATALTFVAWQALYFTPAMIANFPQRTGRLGDWDGDGLPNFLEFAMFLLPVIANANPARGRVGPDGRYHLAFRQSLVALGVLLTLQYSLTLVNWFAPGIGPRGGELAVRTQHRGISANELVMSVPLTVAALLFFRLQAEEG